MLLLRELSHFAIFMPLLHWLPMLFSLFLRMLFFGQLCYFNVKLRTESRKCDEQVVCLQRFFHNVIRVLSVSHETLSGHAENKIFKVRVLDTWERWRKDGKNFWFGIVFCCLIRSTDVLRRNRPIRYWTWSVLLLLNNQTLIYDS